VTPKVPAEQARDEILRGGMIYFIARLFLQIFQWLITLVVARLLLPEDYGLMAISAMLAELTGLLASAGFGSALVQKGSATREQEGQLFTLSLAFAAALYVGVWLAAPTIAAYLGKPDFALFLRVMSLVLWLVPLNTVCGAILERDVRLSSMAVAHVLMGIVQSAVTLTLAYWGFGVWALGAGVLCGTAVHTAALCWRSRWRPLLAWPNAQSGGLVRFGITVALTYLVWFAHSSADKAVITATLGPAVLGLYAMAWQLAAFPVDKITSSANKVAFPVYGRLRSEPERLRAWYLRLATTLFAIAAPVLVGAALLAHDVIPVLLGDKWRGLIVLFQILAPAGVFMTIAATLSPLLNALGRPDIPMKYEIACAAIYPIAFFLAARFHGILGICFVWLLIYPFLTVGLVHATRRITGISCGDFLVRLAPFLKALAAMTLAVLLVLWKLPPANAVLRIVSAVSAGAAVYVGAAILFLGPSTVMGIAGFFKDLAKGKADA
jgi:teichuronic acid exporter